MEESSEIAKGGIKSAGYEAPKSVVTDSRVLTTRGD
jgi:hypothetical protein